jgi:signal transduction histidine kinase
MLQESVVYVLLNVLINAFQSVQERQNQNGKGYVPKVSISTRVLPRFIQVRVHDNGEGMKEEVLKQITDPYFTTRVTQHFAGLGMYFSKKIIAELNGGELKIESLPGEGADVYIKFFTR